jgi:hypothetical protein
MEYLDGKGTCPPRSDPNAKLAESVPLMARANVHEFGGSSNLTTPRTARWNSVAATQAMPHRRKE